MQRRSSVVVGALAASLAVHAIAVALLLSRSTQAHVAPRPMETALIELAPSRKIVASPAKPGVPNRPAARVPVRAAAPKAIVIAPVPDAPSVITVPDAAQEIPNAPTAVAALPAQTGVPNGSAEASAPDDSLALQQLHTLLGTLARRCYSPLAVRMRLTGTAKVRFCLDGTHAQSVTLESSSGEPLLDRAATECVFTQGAEFPELHRCIVAPIEFKQH